MARTNPTIRRTISLSPRLIREKAPTVTPCVPGTQSSSTGTCDWRSVNASERVFLGFTVSSSCPITSSVRRDRGVTKCTGSASNSRSFGPAKVRLSSSVSKTKS